MPTCIYCMEKQPDADFNREHVLPEAFGRYKRGLPRLKCVCASCNSYFGDVLEPVFARGTIEAMMRVFKGLKPLAEVSDIRADRVALTWQTPGDHHGMLFGMTLEEGNLRVEPLAQVGFRKTAEPGYVYVSMAEIDSPSFAPPSGTNPQAGTVTVAPNLPTQQRLLKRLEQLNLPHRVTEPRPWPLAGGQPISVSIRSFVDPLVKRCVAKISFNYAAHVVGRAMLLHDAFTPCREFIRYDRGSSTEFVALDDRPIFIGETTRWPITTGHILTVEWLDNRHIISRFSPFNMVKYRVRLARNFGGIWRPIRSGHVFDWQNRCVCVMTGGSRGLMPS